MDFSYFFQFSWPLRYSFTNFTAIEASGVDPSGESVEHDPCSTGLLVHNLYDSPLSSSLVFLDVYERRPETETLSTLRVILQQVSFS